MRRFEATDKLFWSVFSLLQYRVEFPSCIVVFGEKTQQQGICRTSCFLPRQQQKYWGILKPLINNMQCIFLSQCNCGTVKVVVMTTLTSTIV